MKSVARIILPILGVVIIIWQVSNMGDDYRGLDSPLWGLLLGIGLIVSPFTVLSMFVFYILMAGIPLGLGYLGAVLVKDMFGPSLFSIVGFIGGLVLGGKFVLSDAFDKLLEPLRTLSKDDKNQ